jgi:hypothetical protein
MNAEEIPIDNIDDIPKLISRGANFLADILDTNTIPMSIVKTTALS